MKKPDIATLMGRGLLAALLVIVATASYHLGDNNAKQSLVDESCGYASFRMMHYGNQPKELDIETDELAITCGHIKQMTNKVYGTNQ